MAYFPYPHYWRYWWRHLPLFASNLYNKKWWKQYCTHSLRSFPRILFSSLEDKIHIVTPLCNILYIFSNNIWKGQTGLERSLFWMKLNITVQKIWLAWLCHMESDPGRVDFHITAFSLKDMAISTQLLSSLPIPC